MTRPMVVALAVTAETAQAKAGIEGIVRQVAGLPAAFGSAGRGATAGLAAMGQATRGAAEGVQVFAAAAPRAATALVSVEGAVRGVNAALGSQGAAVAGAGEAMAAWSQRLATVRAEFDPLFAASRRYEAELARIDTALEMNAISEGVAAAARARAAAALQPVSAATMAATRAAGAGSFQLANLSAQFNDIGVMLAAGQSPLQLALQQGTQISQVLGPMGAAGAVRALGGAFMGLLNPVNLLVIGTIAAGAAVFQWLTGARAEARDFGETIGEASRALGRMRELGGRSAADLRRDFGRVTPEIAALNSEMKALEGRRAVLGAGAAAQAIDGLVPQPWLQSRTVPLADMLGGYYENQSSGNREILPEVAAIDRMLTELGEAKGIAAQLDLVGRIKREVLLVAGGWSQVTMKQLGLIGPLIEAEDVLRRIQAAQAGVAPGPTLAAARAEIARLADLDLRIATERNPLLRAHLLAEQAIAEARARGATFEDRSQAATKARTAAIGETLAGARTAAAEMSEEAEARERVTAMVAAGLVPQARAADLLARETALRPLAAAAAAADARTRADLTAAIGALTEAYDRLAEARGREAAAARGRALDEETAALRAETATVGRPAPERRRAEARAAADRFIRENGLTGVEAAAIRRREAERAEAEIARDRRRRAEELARDRREAGFDARAGLARDPIARAAIEAEREYARVLAETGDAEEAAAHAALVRTRALAAQEATVAGLLRTQGEALDRLRLEASLVGASAAVRARALALLEAEQRIRDEGLSADDARAQQLRAGAVRIAEETRALERMAAAWDRVRSAAEGAIDGPIDRLIEGDPAGALEALAKEVTGLFAEIAIKNPLKNALLGTDLPTIGDAGGLGGIWARMIGGGAGGPLAAGPMAVTTPMVTLTAANIDGVPGLGGAAGAAGDGGFGAGGRAAVQAQVWRFFAGKGLAPHQIAAIMGNVQAESAFNPAAVGDGGASFGLFQHHAARGRGLLAAVGGKGGLGNVEAQLEFVWKELMTSEKGVLARLRAAPDLRSATAAFVGFERPRGWTAANPEGAHNWAGRLGAAEAALGRFGTTATDATANLGRLGSGFDAFGAALARGLAGGTGGGSGPGGGGFLGVLVGAIGRGIGIPGFAGGGRHRGGLRIVGEGGPELEYTGPSTILPADLTRAILAPRPAPALAAPPAPPAVHLHPVLVNATGVPMRMEAEETTDARGQRQTRFVLSEAVAEGLAAPGGRARKVMGQQYGLAAAGRRRS